MRKAVKASLLSGLIFPGAGQIYLRRFRRGIALMVPVVAALITIISLAAVGAVQSLKKVEAAGGPVDMDRIVEIAAAYSAQNTIYFRIAFMVIIVCWLLSVIDAYRLGRRDR